MAEDRFTDWRSLIKRFADAVDGVESKGLDYLSAVEEAQNELCVASSILESSNLCIRRLDYEPLLPACTKSIDFRVTEEDATVWYVDVKTIMPKLKDRWDQYERAQNEEWFPKNVGVILDRSGLGGELWHIMFTARSRMLEYTVELETKVREADLVADNTHFVMTFCGEGFHWSSDELEDFVSFYFTGRHRADDTFSRLELKYLADKDIRLNRTVTAFASMSRPQGAIRQSELNWDVQPPNDLFA